MIFVFGSNEAGIHGAGAALDARREHGAKLGVGRGRTGQSYAIPTKDRNFRTRKLRDIQADVEVFLAHVAKCPADTFQVTRLGCGLAGYQDQDIAPMFVGAPSNCVLPKGWREMAGERAWTR